MKYATGLALAAALSLSGAAIADNRGDHGPERSFAQIYSDCGIGAMLFSGDDDSSRTLAIISNVTWDWGTTASSSNASSEENCTRKSHMAAAFIHQHIDRIESDVARGEGEHLAAAGELLGCGAGETARIAREALLNTEADDRVARSARFHDAVIAGCTA